MDRPGGQARSCRHAAASWARRSCVPETMSLDERKAPCFVAAVSELQADPALIEFYTDRFDESTRLSRPDGRLEFMRIQELLRSVLPPAPARVLDVGGATGVHAAWLAQDGYEVELIDIVPAHVRRARELARTLSRRFAATLGDARSLAQEDASCDACLLLGPLYHLVRPEDRARALSEAVRVTRPQGVVVACGHIALRLAVGLPAPPGRVSGADGGDAGSDRDRPS